MVNNEFSTPIYLNFKVVKPASVLSKPTTNTSGEKRKIGRPPSKSTLSGCELQSGGRKHCLELLSSVQEVSLEDWSAYIEKNTSSKSSQEDKDLKKKPGFLSYVTEMIQLSDDYVTDPPEATRRLPVKDAAHKTQFKKVAVGTGTGTRAPKLKSKVKPQWIVCVYMISIAANFEWWAIRAMAIET